MTSGLTNLSPLTVSGEKLPTPQLFHNIPMLHRILEEVVEDWKRAVAPYQRQVDDADDESAMIWASASGFMELQPLLLKCLFSYAFFFVATDNAYGRLYEELNRANRVSGLKVKVTTQPLPKVRPVKGNQVIQV